MDDVAAKAGVSRALVSLVFQQSPRVSDARRAAVLAAAAELDYRPNANARHLASSRTGTIGVFVDDLHNPFYADALDGIADAADAHGARLLLVSSRHVRRDEERAIATLLEHRVDGMILVSPTAPAERLAALATRVPCCVAGRAVSGARLDAVTVDDSLGAELAVEHLVAIGHRRIAHVDGGHGAGSEPRRESYHSTLGRHGLAPHVEPGDFTEQAGIDAARRLLERGDSLTAVFAANDLTAVGLVGAFEALGVRVPEDVSVVGFDGIALAALLHVSLTTVTQPREELGRCAVELLLDRIAAPARPGTLRFLEPALQIRRSTAPPRP